MSGSEWIYLIEVDAYDDTTAPAAVRTLRYASGLGKVTLPSETPAHAFFEPRVLQPVNFTRTAFSDARVMGGSRVGYGELVLNNADQALAALLDYGIDGRTVIVRVGAQEAAYPSGYTTFLTGTAEQPEVTVREAVIRLRDKLAVLALPIQSTKYAGTNVLPAGKEGTANDIKGLPKPLAYGRCFHVPAVLVNTSRLILQVHDGAIDAITAVYDRGVALTAGVDRASLAAMEATAPAAGAYDTCLAEGLIRLGSTPAGRVTVDLRGDKTGGVYVNKVGGIVRRILETRAGVASGDIDSTAFSALDTDAPQEVGIWVSEERNRQDVIDELLRSVGAWLAPNRLGAWQVGRLVAPSGSPVLEFTNAEITEIERIATQDEGRGLPVFRVNLRYKRYYAGFGDADIAGSVSQATRAELLRQTRSLTETDAAVQTKYLLAPELERETLIVDATAAATEAARLLTLHKVRRDYVRATVRLDASSATIDLGSVVRLKTPKLGYSAGRLFVVIGLTSDGRARSLTLELWG